MSRILFTGGVYFSACWDTTPPPEKTPPRPGTPLDSYWNAILLPPANEVCEGYVFTGVCLSTGEACIAGWHVWQGGVHGGGHAGLRGHAWLQGACVVVGGHAWLWGPCMVAGGVHSCRGHAWLWGGMHGGGGACVVVGDMRGCRGVHGCEGACVVAGGHAWWRGSMCGGRGDVHGIQRDTVNERAVHILLECILVHIIFNNLNYEIS